MAVTATHLLTNGDTTNANLYTTALQTPTGNRLVLGAIANAKGAGALGTPTLSGNSITWVEVLNVTFHTIASPTVRLTLFRGMVALPVVGAVVIDFAGVTQAGCSWSFSEFDGVDTGGVNGSAAVLQPTSANTDALSTMPVTLGAFGSANNATYGCFCNNSGGATTINPGTGFTELGEFQFGTPDTRLETEWRADNDTSVDASDSGGGSRRWGAIAIEIKAAGAAPSLFPPFALRENVLLRL